MKTVLQEKAKQRWLKIKSMKQRSNMVELVLERRLICVQNLFCEIKHIIDFNKLRLDSPSCDIQRNVGQDWRPASSGFTSVVGYSSHQFEFNLLIVLNNVHKIQPQLFRKACNGPIKTYGCIWWVFLGSAFNFICYITLCRPALYS